nr:MAG TPA: hypothetical protein [Caudoviricetes sp.]
MCNYAFVSIIKIPLRCWRTRTGHRLKTLTGCIQPFYFTINSQKSK